MNRLLKSLFFAAAVALSYATVTSTVKADDYWTNHWNWYDNTYRPYYYRNYYSGPAYSSGYYNNGFYGGPAYYGGGYYSPGYNGYYGPGYGNYGYGYTPYQTYYGTPGIGVGRTYGGGQALNIGGMTFGWR
jgi:hypothetical protein